MPLTLMAMERSPSINSSEASDEFVIALNSFNNTASEEEVEK